MKNDNSTIRKGRLMVTIGADYGNQFISARTAMPGRPSNAEVVRRMIRHVGNIQSMMRLGKTEIVCRAPGESEGVLLQINDLFGIPT